ncbi:MAG TPA: hypothetical protein VJ276_26365 [Thermoanaerobaculia bacterium]|nr:hypothetical protein [Thermoanaerobaculia bacterium]
MAWRLRLALVLLLATPAAAQHEHHHHTGSAAELFLLGQTSGTAANPSALPMSMSMTRRGRWQLMAHGFLSIENTHQTGPRGREKTFSTNWGMFVAERPVGRGALLFRSMLSLEPATITNRVYPELFQTGETAFGRQIIDGQHPHDFFMELAAEYARPLGRSLVFVYLAPVGDPALGPVAYPHRDSAMEIPQAVLGHHFQDSTHIASAVITGGVQYGMARFEASAFHGAEPDEERWDLDGGKPDSASARLTLMPTRSLTAQASFGYLTKPEKLEPGDAKRWTASISYGLPLAHGRWSSSLIWGRIYKESHDNTLESYLAESSLNLGRHWISARFENAQKDELFPHVHPTGRIERPALPVPTFRVQAYTVGYTIDVWRWVGVGANYTWYRFPAILQGFYGEEPRATMVYLRAKV